MSIRKKSLKWILVLALLLSLTGAGAVSLRASAETAESELLLPGSREEYLELERPSCAAFSRTHFAIADGSTLFIFDRETGEYSSYTHHRTTGEDCDISSVAFTFDGKLFFSDSETHLFRFDLSGNSAELLRDIPCASFAVSGDILYFSAVSSTGTSLYAMPHNDPAIGNAVKVGDIATTGVPCLTADGNKLYCAADSLVHIYERGESGYAHAQLLLAGSSPVNGLSALCCFEGNLYYADEGGLHRSDGNGSETILEKRGIKFLSEYDRNLYVTADGVREAAIGADGSLAFTGYEVGGSSDSYNRLSSLVDVARGGDLLVCADRGNGRVLVWDRAENTYTLLPCGEAQAVSTDGEIVAAAVQNALLLYRKGETEPYFTETSAEDITGVAMIHGKCYYAISSTLCLAGEGNRLAGVSCSALTGDLFGNLYAADAQGNVLCCSEEEFARGESRPLDFTLPRDFRSLRADFEGNLYCLAGSDLYRNGALFSTAPEGLGEDLPVSFTLEEHEDAVLFGYENYILRVRGLGAPVIDFIPTSNLKDRVFSVPASGEIRILSVPAGTPGILTDLKPLKAGEATFACMEVRRTAGGTGILLGRAQNYVLCALYENFSYPVYLLPADCVKESEPVREEPKTSSKFVLSETKFLGYPCLVDSLERETLPRAFPVTVLSLLRFNDGAFGFAYAETADGVRGYLPTNLLSDVEPSEKEPESYRIGYLKASRDGVMFRTESGETKLVQERTQVQIYESGEGRYMVTFDEDGMTYSAQVTGAMIENGNTNIIRISIIIVLCVVAVGLCAIYIIFIHRRKSS